MEELTQVSRDCCALQAMQTDGEAGAEDEAAHLQLEAATQAAAAAAAALEVARRDPAEEQRKQNAVLARSFKAEHFSGAGAQLADRSERSACRTMCLLKAGCRASCSCTSALTLQRLQG